MLLLVLHHLPASNEGAWDLSPQGDDFTALIAVPQLVHAACSCPKAAQCPPNSPCALCWRS